jgi:hypothetical protein
MDSFGIYTNPWILGMVVVLPVIIIGLAKSWKKFKVKRSEKEAATPSSGSGAGS